MKNESGSVHLQSVVSGVMHQVRDLRDDIWAVCKWFRACRKDRDSLDPTRGCKPYGSQIGGSERLQVTPLQQHWFGPCSASSRTSSLSVVGVGVESTEGVEESRAGIDLDGTNMYK